MDEISPIAPNIESISLDPHIEETMDVQTQAQVDECNGHLSSCPQS